MAVGSSGGSGSQGIKAGRAYVEVGTNDAGLRAGLEKAKKTLLAFSKALAGGGGVLLGLGTAIATPIIAAIRLVIDEFSKLNDAAERTGTPSETLSDLGYAAKMAGASMDDVVGASRGLNKTLTEAGQGSQSANQALADLGLTVDDLKGKNLDEQLLKIADAMRGLGEDAQGVALENILGKGAGQALLPMLRNAAELRKNLQENERLGGRVSTEDAANAAKISKAWERAQTAIGNTFKALGASILPAADTIERFSYAAVDAARMVKRFIDENRPAVVIVLGVAAAVAGAGAALIAIGSALAVATVAIGGLASAATALGGVLALVFSPVGLGVATALVAAVVGIAAVMTAFPDQVGQLGQVWDMAWGGMKSTFDQTWGGIKNALKGGDLSLAFEIAVAGLDVIWKGFCLGVVTAWTEAEATLLKGVVDIESKQGDMWDSVLKAAADFAASEKKIFADLTKAVGNLFLDMVEAIVSSLAAVFRAMGEAKAWAAEKAGFRGIAMGARKEGEAMASGVESAADVAGRRAKLAAQADDYKWQADQEAKRTKAAIDADAAARHAAEDLKKAAIDAAAKLDQMAAASALVAAQARLTALTNKAKGLAIAADFMQQWQLMWGIALAQDKQAGAMAAMGAARGQFGAYGAASALGISGDSIQQQQLSTQQQIEKNTRGGGGIPVA